MHLKTTNIYKSMAQSITKGHQGNNIKEYSSNMKEKRRTAMGCRAHSCRFLRARISEFRFWVA